MIDAGKPDRAVPDVVAASLDRLQVDGLADQPPDPSPGVAEEDEVALPFDLAVGADPADLGIGAVLGLAQPTVPAPRRATIAADRRPLPEGLVRAVVVIAVLEGCEAFDLGFQRTRRRARRLLLERQMQPLVTAVLLGLAGAMRSGIIPALISRTANRDRPPTARLAKGGPLSLRIALGKPSSAKARARCGQTCSRSARPTA